MKKYKRSNRKRSVLVLAAIGTVIVISIGAWGVIYHHSRHRDLSSNLRTSSNEAVNEKPATSGDNTANNERKDSAATDTGPNASIGTLDSPTSTPPFSVTVSRDYSRGQAITAAATVNGVSSGTCEFTFAKSADSVPNLTSQSEPVQLSGQSALCKPLTTAMPSKGNWYVGVSVTNNGKTVTAESETNPITL